MRLKTFHGKIMADVMDQVRAKLGPDAIIISIDEGPDVKGVRVTAAIEDGITQAPPDHAPEPVQTPTDFEIAHPVPPTREFDTADVKAVLSHHGLPFDTAGQISDAVDAVDAASLPEAFSVALETCIQFSPLTDFHARPVMLVGPPGAGKTITAAKLTADALLHERSVRLISTDTVKAGGIQQLDHFAQLMRQTVSTADTPDELKALLSQDKARTKADLTIIDTPGTNPFDLQELETLLKFIHRVDVEPVFILPAGLEPLDSQEMAGIFARMGCQRFIATRLDAARRYANLIMAARPGYLALAGFSRSPFVAEGLEAAAPLSLARLLTALPKPSAPKPFASDSLRTKSA